MITEREKMKERLKKMKMRRGKNTVLTKVCKNCNKDYLEAENFQWSCRTHQNEYSGEIWWCCGKENKDQPGCKYSKHESKEEEDEEEENDTKFEKGSKNVRCHCCKELGHTIENCPRDPNIKGGVDTEKDYARIQQIKDYRKLNADTIVTTTHFLKKCVVVPSRQSE